MKYLKIILKIFLLPTFIAYQFTLSLWVMPLIYGIRKWGIIGWVPLWILHWSLLLLTWVKPIGWLCSKSNKWSNGCMGYDWNKTVSSTIGKRVDAGEASWVEIYHLRILATYDSRKYHGSKNAKALF